MDIIKQIITSKIFEASIYIIIGMIFLKLLDFIFKKISIKRGKSIVLSFLKGIIQAIIVLSIIIKLASYSDTLQKFSQTILMSSSLLVVVLGFIFQEGLTNIIHGLILTLFKPFDIGDRVQVNINNEMISGYVKSMTLRHTVITSIIDNAESIIANSQLDVATIKNLSNQNDKNRYPLVITITYQDAQNKEKLNLAKQIISDCILKNQYTIDVRDDKNKPIFVKIDYVDSGVTLTAFITTQTAEENVIAGSEIREDILNEFYNNNISFAYQHLEISGKLTKNEM